LANPFEFFGKVHDRKKSWFWNICCNYLHLQIDFLIVNCIKKKTCEIVFDSFNSQTFLFFLLAMEIFW
jgi:hypothetical protein